MVVNARSNYSKRIMNLNGEVSMYIGRTSEGANLFIVN